MPDPTQEKVPGTASGEAWDPLQTGSDDLEFVLAAQKREIRNILKSYTGYYDLFSELIQNALDAVEKRSEEGSPGYQPEIWITIDIHKDTVSVTDNGCAMTLAQFRGFLKPEFFVQARSINPWQQGCRRDLFGVRFQLPGNGYKGITRRCVQWSD
jgi:hypothetical protein